MPDVILIADDLTGALDTAAPFASSGLPARVIFGSTTTPAGGVTAISTDSRDRDVQQARDAVVSACGRVKRDGPAGALILKKIDSTLRGHVTDELAVVIDQFKIDRILLSPAFPAQGRTTRDGRHHVHGVPLGKSGFAGEDHCDGLLSRFDGIAGLPARGHSLEHVRADIDELAARLAEPGIHIPDVETDADLERCVTAARESGMNRFCGAGGLGRALAKQLAADQTAGSEAPIPDGPVLIVAGSRNQTTLAQVEAVETAGWSSVPLGEGDGETARAVADRLLNGQSVVLSSTAGNAARIEPDAISRALGTTVRRVLESVRPGLLLMTGGDVAAAACRALRVEAIRLDGEFEPGIPCGRLESGDAPGLPVITKAGGFGDREAFLRVLGLAGGQ